MSQPQNIHKTGKKRTEAMAHIRREAIHEFHDFGFHGASILNIAKRCDIPRSNVHYYYPRKEDIYADILNEIVELWDSTLTTVKPTDDPATMLRDYIRRKIEFSLTHPIYSRVFAQEIFRGGEAMKEYQSTYLRNWLDYVSNIFKSWADQGKMDPVDPYHLLFLIWATTQHYADFDSQIKNLIPESTSEAQFYEDAIDTISHIVIKGCGIQS